VKTNADLKSQVAKAAALRDQTKQLDTEILNLDRNERQFQQLKREMTANEKYFRTYEDRLEQARISEDMNRSKLANISVIQPAAVPVKPIYPKKKLTLLVSLFIGCIAGLSFALSTEHLSQGMTTPESAEKRLGLPVLTTISLKET
jgi:uncharacterized protein involved in exopolysaccharide biosynthesis